MISTKNKKLGLYYALNELFTTKSVVCYLNKINSVVQFNNRLYYSKRALTRFLKLL